MQRPTLALVITVALALIGYIATYVNNLILTRRKERLDLINKAINDFYGPLYVIAHVGQTAYAAFVAKIGKGNDPNLERPLTENQFTEWRLWVINVFVSWCILFVVMAGFASKVQLSCFSVPLW